MAGTIAGGKAAAATNKRNNPNFYREIGRKGGSKKSADGVVKGFAAMDKELVREAGRRGGRISRRGKK